MSEQPAPRPTTYVLRAANVLDEGGGFTGPVDVVVRDGRVEAVGTNAKADGAASFDFSDTWIMPGVFDCHTHVALSSIDQLELLNTPITYWALEAGRNAATTLRYGVTSVRDAGGAEAGLRDALAAGIAVGPRMQVSTVLICQTGGHADGYLRGPGLPMSSGYFFPDYPGRPPFVVDGVDAMRSTVRAVLRAGADWIKLAATGGVMSPTDEPDVAELTYDEIATAVFEAGRRGKHVMAHANAGEGLDNALRAGARSIEHGLFMTEEQARRMAELGCWLVPTLAIAYEVVEWAEQGKLSEASTRKALSLKPHLGRAVALARDAGVKLALGTDFIMRDQHGRNLAEISYLREAGLTAEEALLAATLSGAELCGVSDNYGRIAPGHVFDAIVLDGDPGDLSCFRSPDTVTGVFLGGRPEVVHARLATAG
jgi:imidazolonepropionase-like amidohydrolase